MPTDFHFRDKWFFLLLIAIALIALLYIYLHRIRKRASLKFAPPHHLHRIMVPRSFFYQNTKVLFLCFGWLFAVLALMEPVGNAHYLNVKIPGKGAKEVIFLVDDSDSMSVKDTPVGTSRLNFAKTIIGDLTSDIGGENVTLFSFTSVLNPIVPETIDILFVRLMADQIKINESGIPGTDFEKSLEELKTYIESQPSVQKKVLILFSDGGDTLWDSLEGEEKKQREEKIAAVLKGTNVRVLTVGIGSLKGSFIPGLTYQGKPVMSRLQPKLLQALGKYYSANEFTSSALAKQLASEVLSSVSHEGGEKTLLNKVVYDLYFQIPLSLAILFVAAALVLPETEKRYRL